MARKRKHLAKWLWITMWIVLFILGLFIAILPFISYKDVTNYYSFNNSKCFAVVNVNSNFEHASSQISLAKKYTNNIILVANDLDYKAMPYFVNWTTSLSEDNSRIFVLRGLNDTFVYQRFLPYTSFVIDVNNYRIIGFDANTKILDENLNPNKRNILVSDLPISGNKCYLCKFINRFKLDHVLAFVSPNAKTMNVSGIAQFGLKHPLLMCFNNGLKVAYLTSAGEDWFKVLR